MTRKMNQNLYQNTQNTHTQNTQNTQNTQTQNPQNTQRSKHISTDLEDEKGRGFCGTCAKPDLQRHMTFRHFKTEKCKNRSLLTSDNLIPTDTPWRKDWDTHIPEEF